MVWYQIDGYVHNSVYADVHMRPAGTNIEDITDGVFTCIRIGNIGKNQLF